MWQLSQALNSSFKEQTCLLFCFLNKNGNAFSDLKIVLKKKPLFNTEKENLLYINVDYRVVSIPKYTFLLSEQSKDDTIFLSEIK